MSQVQILCRVQALYSFSSNDPSSLSFQQNDFIDVLDKLPSGWWDGLCNGSRGWFPSNYVKILHGHEKETAEHSAMDDGIANREQFDYESAGDYRLSLSYSNRLRDCSASLNNSDHPRSNWTLQRTEDGSDAYFLNQYTGQIKYINETSRNKSLSGLLDKSFSSSESDLLYNQYSTNDIKLGSSVVESIPLNCAADQHHLFSIREKPELPNGSISSSAPRLYSLENSASTSQLSLPDSNNQTVKLLPKSPARVPSTRRRQLEEPLTWNKVSINIAIAIHQLISATKSGHYHLYESSSKEIIGSIRHMLLASSTIDKETGYMKSNGILRSHHRAMMASMSKLVLTTQTSTFAFLTEEERHSNLNKILTEANDLLLAARNFVNTCQSLHIPLIETTPHFVPEEYRDSIAEQKGGRRYSSNNNNQCRYSLQLNLAESLETMGNCIQDSAETIIRTIDNYVLLVEKRVNSNNNNSNRHEKVSVIASLFTHFRNLSNQTSLFVGYLDETNFGPVQNHKEMIYLERGKKELTKCLGLLFYYLQSLTVENASEKSIDDGSDNNEDLINTKAAAQSIIEPITAICESVLSLASKFRSRQNSDASLILPLENDHSISNKASASFVMDKIPEDDGETSPSKLDENNASIININNEEEVEETEDSKQSMKSIKRHISEQSSSQASSISSLSLQKSFSNRSAAAAKKVKRFFGEDTSTSEKSSLNQSIADSDNSTVNNSIIASTISCTNELDDERPFYLRYDYGPDDIVFNSDGGVKGGTLSALVERLTLHDYLDMNFINNFLLTYRSFCTSVELVDLLEARYNIPCPDGLTEEEVHMWEEKKVKLIRLRVFNVLKNWLDLYFYEDDSILLDRLYEFTQTHIRKTLKFSNGQLESLIERRRNPAEFKENVNGGLKRMILTLPDPPEPILPRNMRRIRLLEIDPLEMARQLTIMDFKLYSAIRPIECLDKAWSKDDEGNVAVNIRASIEYCNQITTWVSDVILSQHDIKKRSVLIKYWVQVAEKCRSLNNFNTCMAILSAFDNSSVGRLKRTWEIVGARTNQTLQQIRKLMGANRNFVEYRALIHSINPPCIPFLGIYLQDLTFIEDGNSNSLKQSKDLINFAKRAQTAEVIREIQQYQSSLYQLKSVEELQEYIKVNLVTTRDEEQLYKESLKLEPREREDEKITRLLQESGFL